MDFVGAIRASRCHAHSLTRDQQQEGKPQPGYLSILHSTERKSSPQEGAELTLTRRESWERENTQF